MADAEQARIAQELYERHTGINDWKNIPEEYWNMALEEMKVPE